MLAQRIDHIVKVHFHVNQQAVDEDAGDLLTGRAFAQYLNQATDPAESRLGIGQRVAGVTVAVIVHDAPPFHDARAFAKAPNKSNGQSSTASANSGIGAVA